MNNTNSKENPTHNLIIDGEVFPVFHKERRLYAFVNWNDSRNKLIKVMLKKIKSETGEPSAYIKFKSANPMRRTRLGSFYLDIEAEILLNGKSLGSVEELGMRDLAIDFYETFDIDELSKREIVEKEHAEVDYQAEYSRRLAEFDKSGLNEDLTDLIKKSMENDCWSTISDNRFFARIKRKEEMKKSEKI